MDDECSICKDPFADVKDLASTVRELSFATGCGHVFHSECLEDWANRTRNQTFLCPICREKGKRKKAFINVKDILGAFAERWLEDNRASDGEDGNASDGEHVARNIEEEGNERDPFATSQDDTKKPEEGDEVDMSEQQPEAPAGQSAGAPGSRKRKRRAFAHLRRALDAVEPPPNPNAEPPACENCDSITERLLAANTKIGELEMALTHQESVLSLHLEAARMQREGIQREFERQRLEERQIADAERRSGEERLESERKALRDERKRTQEERKKWEAERQKCEDERRKAVGEEELRNRKLQHAQWELKNKELALTKANAELTELRRQVSSRTMEPTHLRSHTLRPTFAAEAPLRNIPLDLMNLDQIQERKPTGLNRFAVARLAEESATSEQSEKTSRIFEPSVIDLDDDDLPSFDADIEDNSRQPTSVARLIAAPGSHLTKRPTPAYPQKHATARLAPATAGLVRQGTLGAFGVTNKGKRAKF